MAKTPKQAKNRCDKCKKSEGEGLTILRCGRCKSAKYCSVECQKKHWPDHKTICRARGAVAEGKKWYEPFRKCEDGTSHFGDLELITWGKTCYEEGDQKADDELGWGHCFVSEVPFLKRKYEVEFGSDDILMYGFWPQGFRWTCCGLAGDERLGCDHHGSGPDPCQCDFCHMSKPLPDSIYLKDTLGRRGLNLPRGPDPRSFNAEKAFKATIARPLIGMPS
ncbi:hypothetical protein F5B19DRAFT_467837 [Rostrohypoxylon terebratum]|nr:hypothetical protein F5B19DRAFT_467837 [Rostrohypoxylon terebratum]